MDDTYSLPIPEVVPDGSGGAIVRFAEMAQLCQLTARPTGERVRRMLQDYDRLTFDFSGVPYLGPGFTDSVFRVLLEHNPCCEIKAIGTNPSIRGMIRREMSLCCGRECARRVIIRDDR